MARNLHYVNEEFADTIILFDSNDSPVTGEAGNFNTKLQKNGSHDTSPAVSVTEIDSSNFPGAYRITFTPTTTGDFDVRVWHDTYNPRGLLISAQVRAREASPIWIANTTTDGSDLEFLTALSKRGQIDTSPDSATITVYDDSGTQLFTGSDSSPDSQGFFKITWTDHTLSSGKVYYLHIDIVDEPTTGNKITYNMASTIKAE